MDNKPLSKKEIVSHCMKVAEYSGRAYNAFYDMMDIFSRQEAIEFFIWYGVKMMGLLHYVLDIRATITSQELEEKIIEH